MGDRTEREQARHWGERCRRRWPEYICDIHGGPCRAGRGGGADGVTALKAGDVEDLHVIVSPYYCSLGLCRADCRVVTYTPSPPPPSPPRRPLPSPPPPWQRRTHPPAFAGQYGVCPPLLPPGSRSCSPHLASAENNLFLVKRLIKRTDMRNPDPYNKRYTSLAWAAVLGHEETFEFLLSSGHDDHEYSKVRTPRPFHCGSY